MKRIHPDALGSAHVGSEQSRLGHRC